MKLTIEFLKQESYNFDLECVFSLDLSGRGFVLSIQEISDLGALKECVNLEFLNLSYNQISDLGALRSLGKLQYLNLAANNINSLDGIEGAESLKTLNLSGNKISNLSELNRVKDLQNLTQIVLNDSKKKLSNPICSQSWSSMEIYRAELTKMLPSLEMIDGVCIKSKHNNLFQKFEENMFQYEVGLESLGSLNLKDASEPWIKPANDTKMPARKSIDLSKFDKERQAFIELGFLYEDGCGELKDSLEKSSNIVKKIQGDFKQSS